MAIDFRRIIAVSYIQVASDRYKPKDPFEAFFPFIIAAAEPVSGNQYAPISIAEKLRATFGWPVSGDFVGLFEESLIRRGFLVRGVQSEEKYWTEEAEVKDGDEIKQDIDDLQSAFSKFCDKISGLLLSQMSPERRLDNLARTLVTNRLFTQDALELYADTLSAEGVLAFEGVEEGKSVENFDYLCARFIKHTKRHDKKSYESLIRLASIGLISQLAIFFHKRRDSIEQSGKPTIFLDGPFLMDALGFCGEERRDDASIMVNLAKKKGCKIAVFEHSISEARDNVYAVINNDPIQRHGPTASAVRRGEIRTQTLQLFVRNRYEFVRNSGLIDEVVKSGARAIEVNSEYFTDEDETNFWGRLINWKNDIARERDANSVKCIMRIRKGSAHRNPWKNSAFLLTSNKLLQRLAHDFCVKANLIGELDVGPVITRQEFAALLWLAGDAENKAELSSARLMAAAQGVLARDKTLVERLVEYHNSVTGERRELVESIVKSELSYELLQEATFRNPSKSVDEVIDDVVGQLVDQGRREGKAEIRQQRARKLELIQKELVGLSGDYETINDRYEEAERRLENHGKAISIIKSMLEGHEDEWSSQVKIMQLSISLGIFVLSIVLVGIVTYVIVNIVPSVPTIFSFLAAVLAAAFGEFSSSLKQRRQDLALYVTRAFFPKLIEKGRMRLDDRLGVGFPAVSLDIAYGKVNIENKGKILELVN